jgi:hypothetical protein
MRQRIADPSACERKGYNQRICRACAPCEYDAVLLPSSVHFLEIAEQII